MKWGAAALLFSLAGCSIFYRPPAAQRVTAAEALEARRDAAQRKYVQCLDATAARLDDGRSDPVSVAVGVQALCAEEFHATVSLATAQMNPVARHMFEQRAEAQKLEAVTAVILQRRQLDRK